MHVMDYFVDEYLQRAGRPNPCIACNRYVKWEALLQQEPGDRGGLYRHGPLCPDLTAAQRPVSRSEIP